VQRNGAMSVNRRDDIIEAAIEIFAQDGMYLATTAKIADRAGISQPYVYKFISSKEELFVASLERAIDRIIRAFSFVYAPAESLVKEMWRTYEELMKTHVHWFVVPSNCPDLDCHRNRDRISHPRPSLPHTSYLLSG